MANITTAASTFATTTDTYTSQNSGDTIAASHYNGLASAVINVETVLGTSKTLGSVLFAGTSGYHTEDNANLFWDDTNNRLGIGTASPSMKLHVVGDTRHDNHVYIAAGAFLKLGIVTDIADGIALGYSTAQSALLFEHPGTVERMRLTQSGILALGTTDTTGLSAGDFYASGVLKTGAPAGGTAALWKIGTVSVTTPTNQNRTIEVQVGASTYYVSARTVNG
jgi:hypothetical protein